jgi:hypothetical protein
VPSGLADILTTGRNTASQHRGHGLVTARRSRRAAVVLFAYGWTVKAAPWDFGKFLAFMLLSCVPSKTTGPVICHPDRIRIRYSRDVTPNDLGMLPHKIPAIRTGNGRSLHTISRAGLRTGYQINLSFGRQQHFDMRNGLLNAIIGDISTSGIVTVASGFPNFVILGSTGYFTSFTPKGQDSCTAANFCASSALPAGYVLRPDIVPGFVQHGDDEGLRLGGEGNNQSLRPSDSVPALGRAEVASRLL